MFFARISKLFSKPDSDQSVFAPYTERRAANTDSLQQEYLVERRRKQRDVSLSTRGNLAQPTAKEETENQHVA